MFTTIWFILRASFGWSALIMFTTIFIVNGIFRNRMPGEFILIPLSLVVLVMGVSFSHVRRVRLIASKVDTSTLANRQRRQIEIPLEASEAFELVDAAIRELPGAEDTESARDSLQIRAKIKRIDPYQANFIDELKVLDFLTTKRNQILATITPGDGIGSLTLICEPERPAWTDFFLVDNGTNLENAEAITRAITRRIAERRRKEKASAAQSVTEKELTVAKLNLLHAQVEPHFLYNTLASAQLLTRADPAAADQMLGNLITYLRHSLPRTEDTASTIGEELERSIAYLDIMKIRMGTRLNIQIQVPAELKALPFPMMMLQTLVENAIKHGLEPKTGGGTIWIIARQHEGNVAVTVADDGNGLGAEIGGTGIGLKNVRERLRLAHGNAASFVLVGNFPSGVAATITVPVVISKGEQHA
ncbi:sensor histidine kinase [Undibacterium sp. Ji83W]|uniref:sensor histidine kinase n=1 Tax=Undibacterium sp. Ji83W TaxID=3413043 RepID=UPI003BF314CF